jgi:16S rRNA (guanine527-N7)-methyltransferase
MKILRPFSVFVMSKEFVESIKYHQSEFGLNLSEEKISLLDEYYQLIQEHNEILHLVAPCSAEEFATRHILESLTLLEYLPKNAKFADVGTGAGLPSIPCLLVRKDLKAHLIESKPKKARFLEKVLQKCNLSKQVRIINRQFEEVERPDISHVTCRALDKFSQKLPNLLKWSKNAKLLLFAGNTLREELLKNHVKFKEELMPMSEQRFLFISAE